MQRIYPLQGRVQHYSWGGYHFIPQLLQINNQQQLPFAEYWLGAHPNFSATVEYSRQSVSLVAFIEQNKEFILGKTATQQFGVLPFLFKVLDVRQMLSIQVHPTKEDAKIGFEKETAAGIPITAPHRNYKDQNHKPEMMVALSDFWLLHGFKQQQELAHTLVSVPELNFLLPIFERESYKYLYQTVMNMEEAEVNNRMHVLAQRILPLYDKGLLQKSNEDFWAARAIQSFCKNGQYDKGIFSIYLFNLVHLRKGEGIFQPAGMPHAYLEGQNVEVMANSDNVLRGGLTDKYIDVPELIKHTRFEPTVPGIVQSVEGGIYRSPATEFTLHQYSSAQPVHSITTTSCEIILVVEGAVTLQAAEEKLPLKKGQSAFLVAGTTITIVQKEASEFFRVSLPGV